MGVRVAGDKMSVVIAANTSIPTREKKVFATNDDNQTFVAIEIYQGESESVAKNRRLGRFVLNDLTPAPRGRTKVEVSFTLDADGILEVTAIELGTGRAAVVTIEASSGLTADELKQLGNRLAR
jgi:molecular chaperone DnaK